MNLDQLLLQYLFERKKVSIQQIGWFELMGKEVAMPNGEIVPLGENAIQFKHDNAAPEDADFVSYIVEKTGKIRPLAMADLETYASMQKQLLNIGRPLYIEGLGTLAKQKSGLLHFTQDSHTQLIPVQKPTVVKDKIQLKEPVASHDVTTSSSNTQAKSNKVTNSKSSNTSKTLVWIGIILVLLVLIVGVGYYLQKNTGWFSETQKSENSANTSKALIVADTISNQNNIPGNTADTTKIQPANNPTNVNFYIAIKEFTNKGKAKTAYDKLTSYGHTLEISTVDSNTYAVVMPFANPLADTTRAKDSLRRFFGGNPFVIIKK